MLELEFNSWNPGNKISYMNTQGRQNLRDIGTVAHPTENIAYFAYVLGLGPGTPEFSQFLWALVEFWSSGISQKEPARKSGWLLWVQEA